MENNNNETFNDPLSDDSEENLRMENELLRLRLKAELGGDSHSSGNLDPALENEFLKQVMAFESNYANSNRAKVFDILGKPDFKRADELADDLIESALAEVLALLAGKSIEVDFIGVYDNRTKYTFITDELFDHEADDFPDHRIKSVRGGLWRGIGTICGRHGRPSACRTKWSTGPASEPALAAISRTSPGAIAAPIDCLR